ALSPNQRWEGSSRPSAAAASTNASSGPRLDGGAFDSIRGRRGVTRREQPQAVEAPGRQAQEVRLIADGREARATEHLEDGVAAPRAEVQLHGLRGWGEVGAHEHALVRRLTHVREHARIDGG